MVNPIDLLQAENSWKRVKYKEQARLDAGVDNQRKIAENIQEKENMFAKAQKRRQEIEAQADVLKKNGREETWEEWKKCILQIKACVSKERKLSNQIDWGKESLQRAIGSSEQKKKAIEKAKVDWIEKVKIKILEWQEEAKAKIESITQKMLIDIEINKEKNVIKSKKCEDKATIKAAELIKEAAIQTQEGLKESETWANDFIAASNIKIVLIQKESNAKITVWNEAIERVKNDPSVC